MAGFLRGYEHDSGAWVQDIDTDALASTRLNDLLKEDSPLRTLSATQGAQAANRVGLHNSGLNAEYGQSAWIKNATPIALSDAGNTLTQNLANQSGINQFGLQNDQQDWMSSENALDRKHGLTLQRDQQGWLTGENALDRDHALNLQTGQQGWLSGENALDRSQQTSERLGSQDWASEQNAYDWAQKFGFQGNELDLQRWMQDDKQSFEQWMQENYQAWQTGERQASQDWQSSENAFTRAENRFLQNDQQEFLSSENQLDRAEARWLQESSQDFSMDYLQENNRHALNLQNLQNEFTNYMTGKGYEHDIGMFNLQNEAEVALTQLRADINSGLIDQEVAANLAGMMFQDINQHQTFFKGAIIDIMQDPAIQGIQYDNDGNPITDADGNVINQKQEAINMISALYNGTIIDTFDMYTNSPLWMDAWGNVNGESTSNWVQDNEGNWVDRSANTIGIPQ